MEQGQQLEQGREAPAHCFWHPRVETGLSCARCQKPVCTHCMVQAPVGIRCRDCGKATLLPTYELRPAYYFRAIAVALAVAMGAGFLWGIFNGIYVGVPFLRSLVALVVGYGAGELISLSVNRKRGDGLAWIAGGSVVVAFLIGLLIHPFIDLVGLLFIGAGVYIAVQRVR